MNREKALQKAIDHIRNYGNDLVVIDEETIEKSYGWIFFWDHERAFESDNTEYALAGNCPFIVEKDSGVIVLLPTSCPLEHSLRAYELTGNPFSKLVAILEVSRPLSTPVTIDAIKALRDFLGVNLVEAKSKLTAIGDEQTLKLEFDEEIEAKKFGTKLKKFGYEFKLRWKEDV